MWKLLTLTKERYSRHSVGKEFSLGLLEYENARPMYDINEVKCCYLFYLRFNLSFQCNNRWVIQPGLMQEANGNFLPNQDEVTMTVRTDSFKINNYNDVVDEKKKDVQTELSMQPGEFEMYQISKVDFYIDALPGYHSYLPRIHLSPSVSKNFEVS